MSGGTDLSAVLASLAGRPAADAADEARADQDRRWAAGDRVPAEAYLAALPAVAADPEHALVLIYGEVLARAAGGETPAVAEYQARFPHLAGRLADQFALHAALAAADPFRTGAYDPTPSGLLTDPSAPPAADRAVPDRIGEYEILGELGRGGMGVVLAARDRVLDREVAVKTLIFGRPVPADAARRFVRESRITAQLPHPGVPPVHALGELPDGVPFLAMKLVRGRTLDRMLRDRPDPAADRPRFVQAFEQVCQAVGFAHAQGVIHRDLKPANVMVGAFGEVQVMDWGLAKVLARPDDAAAGARAAAAADETHAGSVLGTPAYMPPEQARGEPADARSDVFALGAVLAEVLTGGPAFTGRSTLDVLRKAADGDTADVLARLAACPADPELTDLARRCLSTDPAARPADGKAVADAVAAYRAGVEARLRAAEQERAAAEARVIEQRKRRRVQLALAAAVGLLVAGGGAFAWWQDRQAAAARQRQSDFDLAAARLDADRVRAEAARREQALRVADGVDRSLARLPDLRRQGLWEPAGAAVAEADALLGPDGPPDLRGRVAAARRDLAVARDLDAVRLDRILVQSRQRTPAAYRTAYTETFRRHGFDVLGGDPAGVAAKVAADPMRADLVAALDDWAHWEPDKDTSARTIGVAKAAVGPSWRDLVGTHVKTDSPAALLARFPEAERTPTLYRVVARATGAAGGDEAAVLHDALLRYPGDFWLLNDLALAHEARKEFKLAAEAWRAARAARPSAWMIVNELGVVAREQGDAAAAEAHFKEANRLQPNALSYSNLGNLHHERNDLKAAVAAHREAVRLDPDYANAHNNLGTVLRNLDDIDGAVAEFRAATRLDPADVAPRFNLGLALLTARDDPKAAAAEFREVLRLKLTMSDDERGKLHRALGEALGRLGDRAAAVEAFREVARVAPARAEAHYELADALCKNDRPRAAIPVYREAIRLDPKVAKYHTDLGVELRRLGQVNEAIACHREAVRLDPKFTEAHVNLGSALTHAGDNEAAAAAFRAAVALDPTLAQAQFNLGLTLSKLRAYGSAVGPLREAVRLDPDLPNVRVILAATLFRAGDDDGADAVLRDLAGREPGSAQVRQLRAAFAAERKAARPREVAPPPPRAAAR